MMNGLGPHSLIKFCEGRKQTMTEFSWEHQRESDTIAPIASTINDFIQGKRNTLTNSTIANLVTTGKHYINFLLEQTSNCRPIPGSGLYPLFKEWENELQRGQKLLEKIGKTAYPKRKIEATTNRQIKLTLDEGKHKEELKAIQDFPNNSKYRAFCDMIFSIGDEKEVTEEIYIRLVNTVAISFLISSGQRPEILELITLADSCNIKENTSDPSLLTMVVDDFEVEKKGKTKTTIRVNMDQSTYELLVKLRWMRSVLKIGGEKLLAYPNMMICTGLSAKNSPSWREYGLPASLNFRTIRANISTFVANDEDTRQLNPNVILNHSRITSETSYAMKDGEIFDKAASAIRQKLIPKSKETRMTKEELELKRKESLKELKDTLEMKRGVTVGKSIANSVKTISKGYSLPHAIKELLLKQILSVKVPYFTYALLTGKTYGYYLILIYHI